MSFFVVFSYMLIDETCHHVTVKVMLRSVLNHSNVRVQNWEQHRYCNQYNSLCYSITRHL